MRTITKAYTLFISAAGLCAGLLACWIFVQRAVWSAVPAATLLTLVVLCVLCRCLPLYIRDDCTIDMSFISILATVLLLGPEAAAVIVFLTTPLEIIPTEDGKEYYHIFNTAPSKTFFNMGNRNISFLLAGFAYHALGGTPGDISLPGVLLPGVAFILCSMILNCAILLIVFLLERQITFFPTGIQMFLGLLPSIVCAAPMGYFLALLLQMRSGEWLALLFMLPLLLARFSFKLFLSSQRQQYSIVKAFSAALEAKDTYTEGHSSRVGEYAALIAQHMGLSAKRVQRLRTAAVFHDIGKIGIPDSILRKPGPLTPEERAVIQTHSVLGVGILKNIDGYQEIVDFVLHHHEFYDGRGYPGGTAGDQIPLDIYILGAADAYDAITSDRPYCVGRSPETAARILREEAGKQFHPQVAEAAARLAETGAFSRCAQAMEAAGIC